MRLADRPQPVEEAPFDQFLDAFDQEWKQGEHLSLIGPTGRGKTTMTRHVLPARDYVAVIATKPADPLVDSMRDDGFDVVREWPKHIAPDLSPRLVLWPQFKGEADYKRQQRVIHSALADMFAAGNWTIVLDEVSYLVNTLKLESSLRMLWEQGRSVGITVVAGTQRPAHVPLLMYDQASHLFLFRDNDEQNLKRMAGMGGADSKTVKAAVQGLDRYEVLYVNTGTGGMVTLRPDPLD